jgi:hypothetical protein
MRKEKTVKSLVQLTPDDAFNNIQPDRGFMGISTGATFGTVPTNELSFSLSS